jgi:hypothetical protein
MVLSRRYRPFWIALALLFVTGLSYFSIRSALAFHYANQGTLEGYVKATRLEPRDAENWRRLGDLWQLDLQDSDPQRAIQAYRTSLSLSPNSADAWLGLASVYEGQGKLDAARDALLNAKRSYPVSADVSWRYANFLLRIGERDSAFRELRQTLENEPQRTWEAFSLLQRFGSDTNSLLDRLLPRQEASYLDVIWGLDLEGHPYEALQVWDRLCKLGKEMPQHRVPTGTYQHTQVILFSLVDQLVSKGYIREAGNVWNQVLSFMDFSLPRDPSESLVWDGGFETDLTGGLAWHMDAAAGYAARFSRVIKHSGTRALEIGFDGKHNVDFQGVCQLVVVEPDTAYDFSGWLRTENITTDSGISLRLSTPQNEGPELVTPELTDTHPWTQVGFQWHSAKNVRLAQICVVRRPSYKVYNTIAGTVWVDDVQMVPVKADKAL